MMRPFLPVITGESLTSYLNRAAGFHAGMDVLDFMRLIEFSQVKAVTPTEEDLGRLSRLFGLSRAMLSRMVPVSPCVRMRSLCGEEMRAEFARAERTSYCPACLLEDGADDSPSSGVRVGRIAWRLDPVRTCPKHGIALARHSITSRVERMQLMDRIAPDDDTLARMVREAPRQRLSGLQAYVEDRLSGKAGPAILDAMRIDLAARGCEMLGLLLTSGPHVNFSAVTEVAWNEAGHAGHECVSPGEAGICEGLRTVLDNFPAHGQKAGLPKVLGHFYRWLQFDMKGKPVGPLRLAVREFILDSFPVEAGTDLFGEIVEGSRVHTVSSLAKTTRATPKMINNVMVQAGLANGDLERISSTAAFEAEAGEAMMRRVRHSVSARSLARLLNCDPNTARKLRDAGIIPCLLPDVRRARGIMKRMAVEDVNAFLERLASIATRVDAPSEGMLEIVAATKVSRRTIVSIMDGILSGILKKVEMADSSQKYLGIYVDPAEVREVLLPGAAKECARKQDGA